MTTLSNKRIRIEADAANMDAPADMITGLTPSFFCGNDLQVEFAIFNNTELMETTNIASVTLEVKAMDDPTIAPLASDPVLMSKTIGNADLNATLTQTTWDDGTSQHGTLHFSAAESNIGSGLQWMSLWVLTTDDPAKIITIAAGPVMVIEDGSSGSVQLPADLSESYYTATQSDARYTQRSANLADLASITTARTNLGLGSAALLNSGTSAGNVPVLDGDGMISELLLPAKTSGSANGGIVFEGGHIDVDNIALGRGEFDILIKLQRGKLGTNQYLVGSETNGLTMRLDTNNYLRIGVEGVADLFSSANPLETTAPTWVRLSRKDGTSTIYFGSEIQRTLENSLNYVGDITTLMAQNAAGDNAFEGIVEAIYIFNRGLDSEEAQNLMTSGIASQANRWGSTENIYDATSLSVGKYVYVKTDGSDSITINGTVYADGTNGSTDATSGIVLQVSTSTISNSLSSASTLQYVGALCIPAMNTGAGYQIHDQSANGYNAILTESGTQHANPGKRWQITLPVSATGYIGGSARAIVPAGSIIESIVTDGGDGSVISIGQTDASANIVATHTTTTTKASATLSNIESATGTLYLSYSSGSTPLTISITGRTL